MAKIGIGENKSLTSSVNPPPPPPHTIYTLKFRTVNTFDLFQYLKTFSSQQLDLTFYIQRMGRFHSIYFS